MEINIRAKGFFNEFRMNIEDIIDTWKHSGLKTYYIIFGEDEMPCPADFATQECKDHHLGNIDATVNKVQGYWSMTQYMFNRLIEVGLKRSEIIAELQKEWTTMDKPHYPRFLRITGRKGELKKPPKYKRRAKWY